MIDLRNYSETREAYRMLVLEKGSEYVVNKIKSSNKKISYDLEVLNLLKEHLDIDFFNNNIDYSKNANIMYYLQSEKFIDKSTAHFIINSHYNDDDFKFCESMLTMVYPDYRNNKEMIKHFAKRVPYLYTDFFKFHHDIIDKDVVKFQSIRFDDLKELLPFVSLENINGVLTVYNFEEEIVKKYHNPNGEFTPEFFFNPNLSKEFMATLKSKYNPIIDADNLEEILFSEFDKNYEDQKENIEDHFKNFRVYKIYTKEEVQCVDGEYDNDGKVMYDDESKYDNPDDAFEMLKDNGYFDDLEEPDSYYLTIEDVKNVVDGEWEIFEEDDKWEFLEDFYRLYRKYDAVHFTYFRTEETLKNICFSHKEAVRLVSLYSSDKKAYFESESPMNNDMSKLFKYFRG